MLLPTLFVAAFFLMPTVTEVAYDAFYPVIWAALPVSFAEVGSKLYQANTGRASYLYVLSHLAGRIAGGLVSKQAEKAFGQLLDRVAQRSPRHVARVRGQERP